MVLLKLSGISKQELGDSILKDISFQQKELQKIAIVGETGSGKSTLLKIIAGLIQPDAGEVFFENKKVKGPLDVLIPGHPGIAYLSQHFELRNNYWVEEVLLYTNKQTENAANKLFKICRIDHLLKRRTNQLSGGEKQRIALAKLLLTSPKLLLLDEPFSNLDMIHSNIIRSVIHDISTQLHISCILVSHDPLDILSWADEVLIMKDGQIVQSGSPVEVYRRPVNDYAAWLLGPYNILTAAEVKYFLPELEINEQFNKALLRPEQIKITGNQKNALKAVVQNQHFYGHYSELEVKIWGRILKVKTEQKSYQRADTVFITLSKDDIWFI
jgi:ABC-type glutathione transport system ATPase component